MCGAVQPGTSLAALLNVRAPLGHLQNALGRQAPSRAGIRGLERAGAWRVSTSPERELACATVCMQGQYAPVTNASSLNETMVKRAQKMSMTRTPAAKCPARKIGTLYGGTVCELAS